jgi:hypothetical protein
MELRPSSESYSHVQLDKVYPLFTAPEDSCAREPIVGDYSE